MFKFDIHPTYDFDSIVFGMEFPDCSDYGVLLFTGHYTYMSTNEVDSVYIVALVRFSIMRILSTCIADKEFFRETSFMKVDSRDLEANLQKSNGKLIVTLIKKSSPDTFYEQYEINEPLKLS